MIIHGANPLPRLVGTALADRLRVMPAIVLTGARQTGKSTLVEQLVPGERRYMTLDDLDTIDAARRDPAFELMGIELPVGREFSDADAPDKPAVVVVNEAFAEKYFQEIPPARRA